ncbi:N-acetyl-gamma-glutamyl-phosphate reductase [Imhoffiella purpurea]|uniref:N-acetyl-gamma-glutamyl-phosphate reductase n=1 Tax=Imhoffiella purpurea TaxID=1249627 RepID=W9VAA1_9GAMM|nr:N-acetyl-gamma-glutamyl-phosphate reductase [Imhoffiella purpurea]EXJ13811.1 N-acetyl-gamma-glutamyl-phosphate reductase [Imhoffiella purpurea]
MLRVGIVGGTGYTGAELLRILLRHPGVSLNVITSRGEAGQPVADLFPHLRGQVDLCFSEPDNAVLGDCDLVFFATPNGTAMQSVPDLLDRGVRVIDLAADFRLKDPALWERWYGIPHQCPDLLEEAVYGLPELNRESIRGARLIANPGCYPTAVTLGFLPLLAGGVVDPSWLIADAKSGVSGAGRKATTGLLMAEVGESFKAYSVTGHRHEPEITQNLAQFAGVRANLTFVPHLLPMIRGIEATLYARLTDPGVDLDRLYADRYADEHFIDLMPGGHPDTRSVRGANQCRIAVARPGSGDIVVVQSVIDNLVKGAAGQAVQNMNLMFGLQESMGLESVALLP